MDALRGGSLFYLKKTFYYGKFETYIHKSREDKLISSHVPIAQPPPSSAHG